MIDRNEIRANVVAFFDQAGSNEDLLDVICDYVEKVQDEARAGNCCKHAAVRLPELPEAVGIEIYDLMIEGFSEGHGIKKQIAYHVTRGLLHNYDLYLKERK